MSLVEVYEVAPSVKAMRYWLHERILVGGRILDAADAVRLKDICGVTAVLNLQEEETDADKGLPILCELPVVDDLEPKPLRWFLAGIAFAHAVLKREGAKLYVHCALGGSRSPLMGYAILRAIFGKSGDGALALVRVNVPSYGEAHKKYLASADWAITALGGNFLLGR